MVSDHYIDKWKEKIEPFVPSSPFAPFVYPTQPQIPQEEIDEFKKLLERAREYDRKNNEPDCELEEKKTLLKELAKKLGVEINFL